MLLTLFGVFLALALTCVFLGYYTKESAYSLIGWIFIFFLATTILLPGNLEYSTGSDTALTYTNSSITTISTIDNYATLTTTSSRFFGIWLMFVSIAGIAISLTEVQSAFTGKKNWRSE